MDRLEYPAMDGIVEVLRLQELADLLIGLVVGQDGAQQLLFRLRVVRGDTVAGTSAGRVRGAGSARIGGHGFHEPETSRAMVTVIVMAAVYSLWNPASEVIHSLLT